MLNADEYIDKLGHNSLKPHDIRLIFDDAMLCHCSPYSPVNKLRKNVHQLGFRCRDAVSCREHPQNFGFFAEFNGTAVGKTQHQLIAILSLAQ